MSLGFRCLPLDCSAITVLSPGIKPVQAVTCTDYQVVSNSGSAVNFGRLKAQRLRGFGQKVVRRKQDNYGYDNQTVEEAPLNVYSSSLSKSEFLDQQKRLDAVRCRCLSKESRLPETKSTRQSVRTRGDMDHSEIAVKTGIKHPSKSQHSSTKFKEHERHDVSVPRVPVASLRGWGNGGFTPNVQFKPTDNVKQWWKSPSESAFFSRKSFRELGCNDTMIDSLGDQHILRPSCIQALAFAPVIGGKCCIIADQSGSGKTLAYLLPVIQRLRQEELQGLGKSLPQNPRVVILVPTAELACQVLRNCRSISRSGMPFRSMVATGGFRQRTQLESLQQDLDVLIATPGRFLYLIREGLLQLTNLRCAVLDEVDILVNNEEYEPALQSLINSSPVTTQYLFVTATLPMDIYNKLIEVFPDCEVIMGPGADNTMVPKPLSLLILLALSAAVVGGSKPVVVGGWRPISVAQPLPNGMDQGYIVLNRPWAFVQWLQKADIKEDYILMAEPDHIIVKPIPNLSKDGLGAAFPFFYIEPKKYESVLRKFFPEDKGPITNIDPIGNSPVIVGKESLKKIAPTWMNVSLAMKKDPEADKKFGWVLEMYAYAVASALHGVGNILYKDFMIQPPWDKEIGNKFIIHYTYGCDYDMQGNLTYGKIGEWRFDKRSFDAVWPPKNLPLPPPGVPESVVTLVKMVNEATANIPNWGSS